MRRAVSVTLEQDNVLWLKAQAAASDKGSVSEVLDRLVTRARAAGASEPNAIRSVAGTIDLPEDDPDLEQADAYVKGIVDRSIRRPMAVRERPPRGARKLGRRGGR
ncbi:MAG: hypothetical protein A3H96_10710 [Acidobacteria bacterium RIFCSPLOWO2_02_FULL_67_36]|nr:MAG: hypothetical protein A3H96_10710 [Acidobacteria bacterium RIFCSPLOWO2_02_FULL_67_36]OFW24354.1 MAG: hypothetical protein A3G21_17460 [Acidobacteria bacterium RIFCSPLOWO2_12_FULL_66_21]